MSVNKPVQPSYGVDLGSVYPTNIDKAFDVVKKIGDQFACYESGPDMTVKLAAGKIIKADGALISQAEQTTAAITAPATNPRIDRVVIDSVTGAYSVITGTEAASPTPPAITAGKLPVAQILLQTTTTQITNSMITDERTHLVQPKADNIGAGTLPSGVIVQLGRMQRTEGAADFTGVALADSAYVDVVTLDLGSVNAGDRIFVQCSFGLSTAVTTLESYLVKTNGSTATFATPLSLARRFSSTAITNEVLGGFLRVNGSGTLVFRFNARQVSGATKTVDGTLLAIVLNNG